MARVGYKAPVREGKASLLVYLDPDVRTAFKVATIERGTTMQQALGQYIIDYSAPVLRRLKKKALNE